MNQRTLVGWQTLLADLAIILFMITVAALSRAGEGSTLPQRSPRGEPLAVYRSGKDSPSLGQWLASQPRDARQLLTIVVPYQAGRQAEALADAEALVHQAGEMGHTARIVVEPGDGEPGAVVAFDRPAVARSLLDARLVPSNDWKGP